MIRFVLSIFILDNELVNKPANKLLELSGFIVIFFAHFYADVTYLLPRADH